MLVSVSLLLGYTKDRSVNLMISIPKPQLYIEPNAKYLHIGMQKIIVELAERPDPFNGWKCWSKEK